MLRMSTLLATACLAWAAPLASIAAVSPPEPPPVKDFFASPRFAGAFLSPDGKNVALLLRGPEGNIVLANMPAAGGPVRVIAGVRGMDVVGVHWINDRRLVYSAVRPDLEDDERARSPGLHAVNLDGSKHVLLVGHALNTQTRDPALPPNTHFLGSTHDGSDDVYVVRYNVFDEDFKGYRLFRLNTHTVNLTAVDAPNGVSNVLIDAGGVPRVATRREAGQVHLMYNDPAARTWRELAAYPGNAPTTLTPRFVTRSGEVYVSSRNGRNTVGLYRLDTRTGKLDPEPMVGLKNFDFDGTLVLAPDHDRVLGVRYETSEPMTAWADEGMQQVQQRVDALLPSTINELQVAADAVADAVVVHSYSDTEPGFWQLYHIGSGKLTPLGTSMPQINPLQMGETSFVHIKARDGRDVPAYLTLPRGERKNLPMVVLVHGGPWVRGGHFAWNPQVQFLATRGYAVLQPEFRGSEGYGYDHFMAGWKQWGRAMQDDVADAARWAIDQGVADAKRVCIAGASYGGYATLMGLIRDPALFRCGVDWVGVTDINLIYDERFTSTSQDAKTYTLPVLVGDQDKDAAMLKSVSPLENAAGVTQPLLLAYGGKDRTVPIEQGRKFHAAVKRTNPQVEWIEYEDEGHGWRYERTRIDFWTRVEAFLARQLGPR
ncbi:prolyl oligopeptidase family serine peptidase [Massilia sp. YIM B02763]|uniref:alpha/beta hydrolase family protein n=1 Tax=Massilia sp. YIM B02763 TaxID=3050130 RepID=UPI0025B62E13|nr:prolyl oligopeptidase family serine peptidase [Massilia sp. YIM B02763]MDN4052479.1 prolyl oligopeptidase family serine peptidase [Massilia sp. YIM B02763]